MRIDFYSSTKKEDWPFQVVIDLSKSSPVPQNIDDWVFDLDWQSRVGRNVTKLKAFNKSTDVQIESGEFGVFSVKFKGSFECDLTAFDNSTETLQVADVYVKPPGGKKAKLNQKTAFNWGRSGVMTLVAS